MDKAKKKILTIVLAVVLGVAIIVCSITIPLVSCRNNDPVCDHDFLPATCQSPARCVKCNATTGDKLHHEFTVELSGRIDATCFDDGSVTYECPNCHEQRATVLPRLAHNYQVDTSASVALSCETDEVTGYKCDHCNSSYTEIVTRHPGHTPAENAVWSTPVTQPSSDPCKTVLVDTTPCANEGCEETITRSRIFDSHNEHVVETVDATCVEEGYQAIECDCGELNDVKTIAVKPYAHVWGNPDGNNIRHCTIQGCSAEQKLVVKQANEPITAAELAGNNVAIAMDDVTFAPDATLAGKMADTKLSVTTDSQTIDEIGGSVTVYDLTLKNGDNADVAFDGGKMHVSLPAVNGSPEDDCYVIRVDETNSANKLQIMENTSVIGDQVVFETEHFSYYTVVWLSRDQLCAVIGHNYDTTVVAPTCIHDGLTVKKCRRCNHYETSDPTRRLGHDMQTQVVPATCVDDGYTINTCSRDCGETYINNRVTTRPPHNYVDTVVEPTCTKEGYTLHVCSVCKQQMRDTYVDAHGHSFSNGTCSVCNTVAGSVSAEQNFYTNLIKSLSPTNGYYLSLDGFKLMDGKDVMAAISNLRYSIKIDEQGNLVGKGEGLMTTRSENMGEGVSEQVIVMKGGNIYTYAVTNYKSSINTSRYENYSFSSQSDMPDQLASMLSGEGIENIGALLAKVFDSTLKDSPTETLAKNVLEALFDKSEVDGGYVLTLNFQKAKTLFDTCRTKPFSTVFDTLVGDGAYAQLATLLDGLPEKNTADVVAEVSEFVGKYGLTVDDLCQAADDIIQLIMPGAPLDLSALLSNPTGQVKDLITALGGNGAAIAQIWDTMFDTYNDMLSGEGNTAIDAILALVDRGSSKDVPSSGSASGAKAASYTEEMLDAIGTMLDSFGETGSLNITTDRDGNVQLVKASVDNASINFGKALNISLNAELTPTGDRDIPGGKFERTVNAIEQAKAQYVPSTKTTTLKVNGMQRVFMPVQLDGKTVMVYGTPFENMRSAVVYQSNKDEVATYDGKACTRRVATVSNYYWSDLCRMFVYDPAHLTSMDISADCGGYKSIWLDSDISSKVYYYVYVDANKKVLGWEFAPQEAEEDDYYNMLRYYYNPLTGKYTFESPHNYKVISHKDPVSCSVSGYDKYSCANCGDTFVSTLSIPHNYVRKVEYLKAGSTSCEDGIRITESCKDCDYTSSWTDTWHYRYMDVAVETECGSRIQREICLCGKYSGQYEFYNRNGCDLTETYSGCQTSSQDGKCEHGYNMHNQVVRTCSECGFTMVQHETYAIDGCEMLSKNFYEVDGKQYVRWEEISYQHVEQEPVITENGNIITEKRTCYICNEIVKESRYQRFTEDGKTASRPLYEYMSGKGGYEYVYEGCDVTVYCIDGNGNREEEPAYSTTRHAYITLASTPSTCVRHGYQTRKCLACGDEKTTPVQPYGHDLYYDDEEHVVKCYSCDQTKFDPIYFNNRWWWQFFGFDDLTEPGLFKIGYFMNSEVVADRVEFVVDYGVSGGFMTGSVVDVNFDQEAFGGGLFYDWGRDGEITLDVDELRAKLAAYPDYETFSVVITFSWGKEAMQYALTFTRAEMNAILA